MRKGWKIDKRGWRQSAPKSDKERVDKINKVFDAEGPEAAQAEFLKQLKEILNS